MNLKGRTVLVTGSSRGIGAATARLLAKEGAAVAVNFLNNEAAANKVVEECILAGGAARAFKADVRDERQVVRMVTSIEDRLGAVDALVLNANISVSMGPLAEMAWSDFEAKIVDEMKATFFCVRAVLPSLKASGRGSIVAVSSSIVEHPVPGVSAHCAAKSAMDGLVRTLALELGPMGVRVNSVAPGLTLTDATSRFPEPFRQTIAKMTPLGRIAQPEDIAGVILTLLADETGFLTGNHFTVDGGMHVGPPIDLTQIAGQSPSGAGGH